MKEEEADGWRIGLSLVLFILGTRLGGSNWYVSEMEREKKSNDTSTIGLQKQKKTRKPLFYRINPRTLRFRYSISSSRIELVTYKRSEPHPQTSGFQSCYLIEMSR